MTVFLLIRHAVHEMGGDRIAGRTPGVHLSPDGIKDAERLAQRLKNLPIKAIYASPLERTQETAACLSRACDTPVQTREELIELGFGDWTGQRIEDLRPIQEWQEFNEFRSGSQPPHGELMLDVQTRAVRFMLELKAIHPNEYVALVSHGDVIKSALAYFLGIPIDLYKRMEISPASVSVLEVADYGPWILCVNNTGDLPALP